MPWKKKDTRLAVLPFEVFKNVLLVSLNNLLWNAWHKTTERLRWQMLTCAPPSLRNPVTAGVGACGAPSHRVAPPFPRNPPCPSGAPSVVYRDRVLIMEQGSRCLQKNVFIFSLVSRWLFTFWFASPNWPCPAHPSARSLCLAVTLLGVPQRASDTAASISLFIFSWASFLPRIC